MHTKTRYYLLDSLRGLWILAMVAYHALWDMVNIYGVEIPWFASDMAFVVQRTIRWGFLLLSGFCLRMGSRPLKRGFVTLAAAVVVTLVSMVAVPGSPIRFGVLSFIGTATVLTGLLDKGMQKLHPYIGLAVSLGLFILTMEVNRGYLAGVRLPVWLYANDFTAFLGLPHPGFVSSDYVPVIPWLFAYWIGYYSYGIFLKHGWLKLLTAVRIRPLEFLGRHSLIVYMVHQPVVYAILALIF